MKKWNNCPNTRKWLQFRSEVNATEYTANGRKMQQYLKKMNISKIFIFWNDDIETRKNEIYFAFSFHIISNNNFRLGDAFQKEEFLSCMTGYGF